jgi:hypothetical protein
MILFGSPRVFGLAACAVLLTAALPASASEISNLVEGGTTLGTVELTQNGADEVDVVVTLKSGTDFSDATGNAFAFNLDLPEKNVTVTVTSPTTAGLFTVGGSGKNNPFGTFTNTIDCPGCASLTFGGPLDFKVVDPNGISLKDFVDNKDGVLFSADLIGGGYGKYAENAYSDCPETVAATPIIGALPLFASGAGIMGLFGARRRRKAAVVG